MAQIYTDGIRLLKQLIHLFSDLCPSVSRFGIGMVNQNPQFKDRFEMDGPETPGFVLFEIFCGNLRRT